MPVAEELVDRVSQLPPDELEDLMSRFNQPTGFTSRNGGHDPIAANPSNVIRTPGVCGGSARIIRTRIPVWVLEQFRRLGMSEAELLRSYPTLRAIDLVEAWRYADTHVEEIDREILENEED